MQRGSGAGSFPWKIGFFQGQKTGLLGTLNMLAHQTLEAFKVLLLHVVHQLVVLGVGGVAAILLGNGHGGNRKSGFD